MLSHDQINTFRRTGHLTVETLFDDGDIDAALGDVEAWSKEFLDSLTEEKRAWFLERSESRSTALRKLDNPVFHRPVFARLAMDPRLVEIVHQLIGGPVSIFFSQVFMKPPGIGGPKPIHQDNFYFGPSHPDATLTAWIALDEATIENGCLHYCDIHQSEIAAHVAPEDEPFNLQIPKEVASQFKMLPAPVSRGGVSFHHGNTPHQSSSNCSDRPRRAAAFHYLREDASLTHPALEYDHHLNVRIG